MQVMPHQEWQDGRGNHVQVRRVRANTVDCRDVTRKYRQVSLPKSQFNGKPWGLWRKAY